MAAVRVAIVGAGLMGAWHARYALRAGGRIAIVVDRQREAAQRLAERVGARALTTEDDWLAAGEAEFVHVCTPWHTHLELAHAALGAGAHVIVEKPVADTRASAEQLAAAAVQSGRMVVPVHQFPFQRGVRRLLAQLGSLGTLRSVELVIFTAGADRAPQAARRAIALEILPHAISIFHALGFVVPPERFSVDRFCDDALELSAFSGAVRLSTRLDLSARPTCNELRIAADGGSALADLFHGYAVIDRAGVSQASKVLRPFRTSSATLWAAVTNLGARAFNREPAYPGLRELIRATYEAVRHGTQPPILPVEYIDAAALSERLAALARG